MHGRLVRTAAITHLVVDTEAGGRQGLHCRRVERSGSKKHFTGSRIVVATVIAAQVVGCNVGERTVQRCYFGYLHAFSKISGIVCIGRGSGRKGERSRRETPRHVPGILQRRATGPTDCHGIVTAWNVREVQLIGMGRDGGNGVGGSKDGVASVVVEEVGVATIQEGEREVAVLALLPVGVGTLRDVFVENVRWFVGLHKGTDPVAGEGFADVPSDGDVGPVGEVRRLASREGGSVGGRSCGEHKGKEK